MAFPGRGSRRTSNPVLLAVFGLLVLSAPWWLPVALPPMHFTRVWTIAFAAFALLCFGLAWESYRSRTSAPPPDAVA